MSLISSPIDIACLGVHKAFEEGDEMAMDSQDSAGEESDTLPLIQVYSIKGGDHTVLPEEGRSDRSGVSPIHLPSEYPGMPTTASRVAYNIELSCADRAGSKNVYERDGAE